MFKNWALRKIFGPKREKVIGELRKLHNKKLHDWYCPLNIIRVIISRGKKNA
jgi:hypothetical protein